MSEAKFFGVDTLVESKTQKVRLGPGESHKFSTNFIGETCVKIHNSTDAKGLIKISAANKSGKMKLDKGETKNECKATGGQWVTVENIKGHSKWVTITV